jgi:hypothetical protein
MNIIFYIANGLVMPPAMFFAINFYKFKGSEIKFKQLKISICILAVTVLVTSLQFVFPEIIIAFERNRHALLAGEVWRLITPLFVQPMGIFQCMFNGLFFVAFVPTAEHLYGRSLLFIYFGTGLIGQICNYYWETTPGGLRTGTGGSSTALFGAIGSLLMYIVLSRKVFPKGYILIPIAGFLGAVVLVFFEDAHASSLLVGGALGLILRGKSQQITAYPQVI